jgi:hypothetical protein
VASKRGPLRFARNSILHRMAKKNDKNYVSFWFWFFALLLMAIPCIGWILIVIWAFYGENESRKNLFRAWIAWALIIFTIWLVGMLLGFWPFLEQQLVRWMEQWK